MASHTLFLIAAFFYLLATKLSDAHEPPAPPNPESPPRLPETPPAQPKSPPGLPESPTAQPKSPPGKPETPPAQPESPPRQPESPPGKPESPPGQPESPPGKPETPPGQPESQEEFGMRVEINFLMEQKKYWVDLFGNGVLPPAIDSCILYPPPPLILQGAKAMSDRLSMKRSATFEDSAAKIGIGKAIEVPKLVPGAGADINPMVKTQICANLKKVIYDQSTGEPIPDLDIKIEKFVDFLASGSKTGGGSLLSHVGTMTPSEMISFRDQMAITLGGNLPGQGLKIGWKGQKDAGFTKAPPMSSILPVAKCVGAPDLDTDIHDKSVESLYFHAKQLTPGQKFSLDFGKTMNYAAFMSPGLLDKSGSMASFVLMDIITILTRSMDGAQQANIMPEIDTVSMCEQPGTKGKNKEKCCATDLQTMMNFTQAKVGADFRAASLWFDNAKAEGGAADRGTVKQEDSVAVEYTISKMEKLPAVNIVGCSKLSFSIAVFYCEALPKTVGYTVELTSASNVKVKAPVICHEDTTTWNPKSWIFKKLGCQPAPATKICHFLAADDVAWMPKTEKNTVG